MCVGRRQRRVANHLPTGLAPPTALARSLQERAANRLASSSRNRFSVPKTIEAVDGASSHHPLAHPSPRRAFDLDDVREASPALEDRRQWFALALIVLHAILAWHLRAPSITTRIDDTTYILLARSLVNHGYQDLFLRGAPLHSQYPPGYPALLALLSTIFGERVSIFVIASIILSSLALGFFYLMARRRWPADISLLALALAAVNPSLVYTAGRIASEPLFMALTMLALLFLTMTPATGRTLALASVALVGASLTRSIGVTLVAATGLLWLIERRYKHVLALAAAGVLTIGAWLLWTVRAPQKFVGRSYIADFTRQGSAPDSPVRELAYRLMDNAKDYFAHSLPWIVPWPTIAGTVADNALWLLLDVGLGAVGVWLLWRRHRIAALALGSYCALLAIWPWPVARFLFPILPIILLVLLVGAAWLSGRVRWPGVQYAPLLLGALIIGTALSRNAEAISEALACERDHPLTSPGCFNPDQRSVFAAAEFAKRELPASAGIVVAKDAPFGYLTGRQTFPFAIAWRADSARYLDFLVDNKIQYVLLGNTVDRQEPTMGRKLLGVCGHLEVIAAFPPRTNLFRVHEGPSPDGGAAACKAIRYTLASARYAFPLAR